MRRYRHLAVAVLTALLTTVAMASPAAAATNVLTYGSVTGPAVAVNDILTSNLKAPTLATFYSTATGTTGVKCSASSFSAKVKTNPNSIGTATLDLTSQTFGNCTTNVFGTTGVQSLTVNNLPFCVSITSAGVVTIAPCAGTIQTTVKINTLLGPITCVYQSTSGSLIGQASNVDNSLKFTNQQFTKISGPSTCLGTAYFSATYAPVTGPGGLVFVH